MRWAALIAVLATPAAALDLPSGQSVELQEVLIDELGSETWLRFRFIAPAIARESAEMTFEQVESDFPHLCEDFAIPYIAEYKLEGDVIVISLSDRATEFGAADPDATQFFEAFRPDGAVCVWEGL